MCYSTINVLYNRKTNKIINQKCVIQKKFMHDKDEFSHITFFKFWLQRIRNL